MATLTVGVGQQYTTIASAVAASSSGDTIKVQAGTYTNDFVTITHDLTLNAVGGTVALVATAQPPNGKAIIDEGGSGVSVTINGFDMSGATVPDGNGAAVRYEGGTLTLSGDTIHDNQEGLLAASDPNGSITINGSTFANNGTGTGTTHNIYVADIASLTVENSTITGAIAGHDIKSRAETTTITNNTITDGASGTASYEIDLPNGGNAVIEGNVIENGANAQNPIAISYGEDGGLYGNSSLTVSGNTILNDDKSGTTIAVANDSSVTASITNNSVYGWSTLSSGSADLSGNTTLATEPSLSSLTTGASASGSTTSGSTGSSSDSTDPTSSTTATGSASTAGDTTGSGSTTPVTSTTVGTSGLSGFEGSAASDSAGAGTSSLTGSEAGPAMFAAAASEAGAQPYSAGSSSGSLSFATDPSNSNAGGVSFDQWANGGVPAGWTQGVWPTQS